MNTNVSLLELFNVLANLAIVPLVTVLFSMQGRLSRIEGQLYSLAKSSSKE